MRRVFISFASEDIDFVRGVRLLTYSEHHELDFYDESVKVAIDSVNATYIKRVIREKIARASVTVCLVGYMTASSEWVRWELQETVNGGKTMIFMRVKNIGRLVRLPDMALRFDYPLHDWNPTLLAQLIALAP